MNKLALIAALSAVGASSAALAQTTQPTTPPSSDRAIEQTAPAPSTSAATAAQGTMMLTDAEAKAWVDKVIYSSDGKNVGEVAAFARDSDGKITEMHADVGGFLGLGETRVRILPSEFKLSSDRVVLNFASDKIKTLPHLPK